MKKLLLVGAGYAHLAVLHRLTQQRFGDTEVSLICAERYQRYSGMLPAWMAGYAIESELKIDLLPLCKAAGIQWIQENMLGMDAQRRCIATPSHPHIEYDVLSLNTGAESNLSWLSAVGNRLLPIRPLSSFVTQWPFILAQATQQPSYQLVIVGAGAAAVELAMAAQVALQRISSQHRVTLVCGKQLLPAFSPSQVNRVTRHLQYLKITIAYARAAGTSQGLLLSNGEALTADHVIAATGTTAPLWPQRSKLVCSTDGFIQVDATHQSISHPDVFAVGDICQRIDQPVARSGVHAVHAGKILADNLLAYLKHQPLQSYRPKANSLYLLSCGTPYAIGCWGRYHVEGAWVWRIKQYIDHGFVQRYRIDIPIYSGKMFWKMWFSRETRYTAIKVALVVGTILNLINQGSALWGDQTISWLHVLLNYIVPYSVASYSTVRTQSMRLI